MRSINQNLLRLKCLPYGNSTPVYTGRPLPPRIYSTRPRSVYSQESLQCILYITSKCTCQPSLISRRFYKEFSLLNTVLYCTDCTGSFSQNSLGKFTSQGNLLTLLRQKSQQPKKSTQSVGAWSASYRESETLDVVGIRVNNVNHFISTV
jgi:hypothetical protein